MRALVLAAALLAAPAMADMLARHPNGDQVRLRDTPCADQKVLDQIPQPEQNGWQAASAIVGGTPYVACWSIVPQGVYLIYQDGDKGLIPFTHFKPAPDA